MHEKCDREENSRWKGLGFPEALIRTVWLKHSKGRNLKHLIRELAKHTKI